MLEESGLKHVDFEVHPSPVSEKWPQVCVGTEAASWGSVQYVPPCSTPPLFRAELNVLAPGSPSVSLLPAQNLDDHYFVLSSMFVAHVAHG